MNIQNNLCALNTPRGEGGRLGIDAPHFIKLKMEDLITFANSANTHYINKYINDNEYDKYYLCTNSLSLHLSNFTI